MVLSNVQYGMLEIRFKIKIDLESDELERLGFE